MALGHKTVGRTKGTPNHTDDLQAFARRIEQVVIVAKLKDCESMDRLISHIVKLFEEYPVSREWWNEQRKELAFPNGSLLFFGSAEHEKDMANFYSAEFADIMVDEAQEFSQEE